MYCAGEPYAYIHDALHRKKPIKHLDQRAKVTCSSHRAVSSRTHVVSGSIRTAANSVLWFMEVMIRSPQSSRCQGSLPQGQLTAASQDDTCLRGEAKFSQLDYIIHPQAHFPPPKGIVVQVPALLVPHAAPGALQE